MTFYFLHRPLEKSLSENNPRIISDPPRTILSRAAAELIKGGSSEVSVGLVTRVYEQDYIIREEYTENAIQSSVNANFSRRGSHQHFFSFLLLLLVCRQELSDLYHFIASCTLLLHNQTL